MSPPIVDNVSDLKIAKFLNSCAAPRKWKAKDGKWISMVNWTGEPGQFEMETGYTLRAKELRDLYNALKMEGLNREERIDMLLTLKNIVAGVPDCKLTKELIGLAEREAEMLVRGVNSSLLNGLRARILHLYLQFCRDPKFNPEAARHLTVPQVCLQTKFIVTLIRMPRRSEAKSSKWDPLQITFHIGLLLFGRMRHHLTSSSPPRIAEKSILILILILSTLNK